MFDLYVYYKVPEGNAGAMDRRLRIMQAELCAMTGVDGQIKRRRDNPDGLQTWMEVYTGAGEGFEAALCAAVRKADIPQLIDGPRHTEIFVDIEPCA